MTANGNLLREAGEALFGERWQSELSRALDVNDRTIRRWDSGEWEVPATLWKDLREVFRQRSAEMAAVRRRLPR